MMVARERENGKTGDQLQGVKMSEGKLSVMLVETVGLIEQIHKTNQEQPNTKLSPAADQDRRKDGTTCARIRKFR